MVVMQKFTLSLGNGLVFIIANIAITTESVPENRAGKLSNRLG